MRERDGKCQLAAGLEGGWGRRSGRWELPGPICRTNAQSGSRGTTAPPGGDSSGQRSGGASDGLEGPGAQPVRWGHSGNLTASGTRPCEEQGDDPPPPATPGTRAHCWPSVHTSMTLPVGTAQGAVFISGPGCLGSSPGPTTSQLGDPGQVSLSLSLRLLHCESRVLLGGQ